MNLDRRRFVKGAGAAGLATIAGCVGDSDDEKVQITLATSAEGTGSHQVGVAVEAIMRESDQVSLTGEITEGTTANITRMNQGEYEAITATDLVYAQAFEGRGDFEGENITNAGLQGPQFFQGEYFLVTREDTDIENLEDISGHTAAVGPTGSSPTPINIRILQALGVWDDVERRDIGWGDHASALESERVDVVPAFTFNDGATTSAFNEEIGRRVNIKPVSWTDDQTEVINEEILANLHTFTTDAIPTLDAEINSWTQSILHTYDSDLSEDTVYHIAETLVDNSSSLTERVGNALDISNEENFTGGINADYPVHPGIASYLKDQGWWDDSWEIGG